MLFSARGCAIALSCAVFSNGAILSTAQAAGLPDAGPGGVQTPVPHYSEIDRERRLAAKKLAAGSPVMIRIFKKESELELWLQKNGRFELFETYAICMWSGKLGPKRREGDLQAPEGFYRVDVNQLRLRGKNSRTFYLDYPNAFDQSLGRTGSAIMVHGHCQSIGCFAMHDPAMEEIYVLVERALFQGQIHIELHSYPFRMTEANLLSQAGSDWQEYWRNLKVGYDLFEETRLPPAVSACGGKYVFNGASSTQPDIATPPQACELEAPTVEPAPVVVAKSVPRVKRWAAAARRYGRRAAGRNARKAYAGARRARVAAHAARMRASQ